MNLHSEYEYQKAAWLLSHPDATASEYEEACRRIARKLGI